MAGAQSSVNVRTRKAQKLETVLYLLFTAYPRRWYGLRGLYPTILRGTNSICFSAPWTSEPPACSGTTSASTRGLPPVPAKSGPSGAHCH